MVDELRAKTIQIANISLQGDHTISYLSGIE